MQTETRRPARHVYVIPCSATKLDRPAPARELYTSNTFTLGLAAAEGEAAWSLSEGHEATVLVLSALHGLVTLDTVLEPYDVKMGQAGSITAEELADTAADLGLEYGDEVYGFLPAAYREALAEALAADDVLVHNVYEAAAPGFAFRKITAQLAHEAA